ncbi:hypothetical protein CDD83_5736 [Cordyceps sp. RAO-2017]|nr:hypothetical protein CDD83_5736 [Cordyceps sp. RAO-2017]
MYDKSDNGRLPAPYEWNPTRQDAAEANRPPDATLLQLFKQEIAVNDEFRDCEQLVSPTLFHERDSSSARGQDEAGTRRQYSFPADLLNLNHLPDIPYEAMVANLQPVFYATFKSHVFLEDLDIASLSDGQDSPPPFLAFSLACLASVWLSTLTPGTYEQSNYFYPTVDLPSTLFWAGVKVWAAMIEIDNREVRRPESAIATVLLATYGMLSADQAHWARTTNIMAYSATMMKQLPPTPSSRILVSYGLLVDVLRAVVFNDVPNFSTTELVIMMPSSADSFPATYKRLLQEPAGTLPADISSRGDAILLLSAVLCDTLFVRRSYSTLLHQPARGDVEGSAAQQPFPFNPYAALSPESEMRRQYAALQGALDRWSQNFGQCVEKDILALFYFCRLFVSCPELTELPRRVGYALEPTDGDWGVRAAARSSDMIPIEVSEEAASAAWSVLHYINVTAEGPKRSQQVWMPIALFCSALVIWQSLLCRSGSGGRRGTLKVLNAFIRELEQLPWPCCGKMSRALERIIADEQ